MQSIDKYSPFALFAIFIASLSGFLFGYYSAIISGVLKPVAITFQLTVLQEGFLVSILLLGGIVGALPAGMMSDKWGRRNVLLITALIFTIAALLSAWVEHYDLFFMARFLCGIALGITSAVTPLYLAEVAPPHYRGRFVCLFQIMIAAGILAAYGVNVFFATDKEWRIVFLLGIIPSMIQFIGLFLIPESPAWLFHKKRPEQAKKSLTALRKDLDWQKHIGEMKSTAAHHYGKKAWTKALFYILTLGFLLSIFQQITGINTVIYYAPTIFGQAGTPSRESALMATFIVGSANLLVTLVAVWLIDKVGRRILLLIGTLGMTLCLALLVAFLHWGGHHLLSLSSVVLYVSFFALSLGPITWVILSEIFPLNIRGFAMGICTFANWLFNYIVALTFLLLIEKLGIGLTFALYAVITLICFCFIYFCIPETKGKSLEEIEEMLT